VSGAGTADRGDAPVDPVGAVGPVDAVAPVAPVAAVAAVAPVAAVVAGIAVAVVVVVLSGVRLALARTINVNWDEFYFLSRVHTYLRDELTEPLLTFHVHFLGWVTTTSTNEVDQVLALRGVMLGLGGVAAVSAWWIGRRLTGNGIASALAVVLAQSFSNVLNHGAAARFDAPVVACALVAAALLLVDTGVAAIGAGIILALGACISIKSAFYLPTLFGLVVGRALFADRAPGSSTTAAAPAGGRATFGRGLVFAATTAVVFVVAMLAHKATLATTAVTTTTAATTSTAGGTRSVGGIAAKVLAFRPRIPNKAALLGTLDADRWWWGLLVAGVVIAVVAIVRGERRRSHAQALCFVLPVATLFVYRNSFAYFYVSVVPFVGVLVAVPLSAVARWIRRPAWGFVAMGALVAPSLFAAATWVRWNAATQTGLQRQVIDVVHEIFPTPVPYVDRCAMVGSFKKVGPFMSTWTLSDYRDRGAPVFAELLRREAPLLLLENVGSLRLAQSADDADDGIHRLLPADFAVLQENFVPHWGPVRVAGKQVALTTDAPTTFSVLIPGDYVIELGATDRSGAGLVGAGLVGTDLVDIDGVVYGDGEMVTLGEGPHTARGVTTTTLGLRTAQALPPPTTAPLDERLFVGFRYRTARGWHR
jgi:hypothetical protein